MVCLIQSHYCRVGAHSKCNGGDKAPEGHFGGTLCTCSCHHQQEDKPKVMVIGARQGGKTQSAIQSLTDQLAAKTSECKQLREALKIAANLLKESRSIYNEQSVMGMTYEPAKDKWLEEYALTN